MNRSETAKVYALVCGAYDTTPSEVGITAWHALLADLEFEPAMAAARKLCLRDTSFPPRPGEVAAEVAREAGDTPPPIEAAIGYYLAGHWDAHPLVAAVAAGCQWDRVNAPEEAKWDFRARYQAALHDHDLGVERPAREALTDGPTKLAPLQLVRPVDE